MRIEYYLNPVGTATLTEIQLVGMLRGATAVWERANPRIHFVYMGTTTTPAGVPDGKNVVGFGMPLFPTAMAMAPVYAENRRITDADIVFNADIIWSWEPCRQRDASCGRRALDGMPFSPEIQGVATHELGHWLSLDHPNQEDGVRQTLAVLSSGDLSGQTLALGDIVGVRAMYPCGKCGGRPVVYVP